MTVSFAEMPLEPLVEARGRGSPARRSVLLNLALQVAMLFGTVFGIMTLCAHLETRLPAPSYSAEGGVLKDPGLFYEEFAAEHLDVIARKIGMRPTGSYNEVMTHDYIIETLAKYKHRLKNPHISQFDIDLQISSGNHEIRIARRDSLKSYRKIRNVVARLSCGDKCTHSLLLNTHYDSTISTMGAGDSAVAAAAMLELVRAYTQGDYELKNSLLLVWNGAEETLFDGAHSFYTQHEYAQSAKALVNMDAIGIRGGEVLFQVNSDLMLKAYSGVPYPQGSTFCKDFFNMGLITSNTDFATFTKVDDKLIGVDLALFRDSYYYHSLLDTPGNVPKGTLQNLGDNILHMTKYLLQTENIDKFGIGLSYFYYSFYRLKFFLIKWKSIIATSFMVCALSLVCTYKLLKKLMHMFYISPVQAVVLQLVAVVFYLVSIICGAVGSILFAAITSYILGKSMLWYYPPKMIFLTAVPSHILGSFVAQFIHSKVLKSLLNGYKTKVVSNDEVPFKYGDSEENGAEVVDSPGGELSHRLRKSGVASKNDGEKATPGHESNDRLISDGCTQKLNSFTEASFSLLASSLTNNGTSLALAMFSMPLSFFHQGFIQFTIPFSLFSTLALLYDMWNSKHPHVNKKKYQTTSRVINSLGLFFIASEINSFSALVIPVSSIAGGHIRVDLLMYALLSAILHFPVSILYPSFHSIGLPSKYKKKALVIFAFLVLLLNFAIAIFKSPYDEFHPKRVYMAYASDRTNNENSLFVGFSDYGYIGSIVSDVRDKFGLGDGVLVDKTENESKMIGFHPFRDFLRVYKFKVDDPSIFGLDEIDASTKPTIEENECTFDSITGLMKCDITIHHNGLIYLVVQVDAEVHSWPSHPSFEKSLLPKRNKYLFSDLSGYGVDTSVLSIEYKPDAKNFPSITISGLARDIFSEAREVSTEKGAKGMLVLDKHNPYSIMYHKLYSALPDWTTPMIVRFIIASYNLRNSE